MTPPIRTWPALVLIAPIRFYQRFITPYTPATCRYYPTCSAYAVTALRTRGAVVGTGLTIRRLVRCNPWSEGGIDHVPARGHGRHRADRPGAALDQAVAIPAMSTGTPESPPEQADLSGAPPSVDGTTTSSTVRGFAA